MKIVLNGIETNNKGAELMLYAILQQIEKMHPDAKVYLPFYASQKDLSYIQTSLQLRNIPFFKIRKLLRKTKLPGILNRLGINVSFVVAKYFLSKVEYFIDASGFCFSDQWHLTKESYQYWIELCKQFGYGKSRMIFLPQAFGPVEKEWTIKTVRAVAEAADVLMPREKISEDWLIKSGVDKAKIKRFSDFTVLVDGLMPKKYDTLKNSICIIPNCRMIDKNVISYDNYLDVLKRIASLCRSYGYNVYLLNHEGKEDENFAYECAHAIKDIPVVTGLNALEVKGLISSAYLCISSRFHGVASSLNSCVPCLSTSWSHKYEELYKDYKLPSGVLDLTNTSQLEAKIQDYMNPEKNKEIRQHLESVKPAIVKQAEEMWETVWSIS